MVEDHEGAEGAAFLRRFEERIDHRQPVAEHIRQRHRHQFLAAAGDAAVGAALAVFDDAGLYVAVLHHHRVIEHRHIRHAAMAMPGVEIGAEHRILLRGRHRAALFAGYVGIAGQHLPEIARGPELVGDHAHGDAGAALVAGRPVSDRLAAAEAAMGQEVVEIARLFADQVRKHLALMPARQIGAGRGCRQVELRGITRVLGQGTSTASKGEAEK